MVTTRVAFVRTGSQASEAGVTVGQRVVKLELVRTDDGREDSLASKNEVVDLDPQDEEPRKPVNWAAAFSAIQEAPFRKVVLHLTSGDDTTASTIATWDPEPEMFLPIRGFITERLLTEQKADGIGHAFSMGLSRTRKTLLQIYLTLKALLTGRISPKELHGPVGIAQVGYKVAEQGISELLIFLGFLSVNLAVLNFLPIPILDGGHMVFLTYEAVAGKKPSDRVYVVAQYIGLAFILGLMLFVLGQDFLRILGYRN